MTFHAEEENLVRLYLLGEAGEEERRRVEERLLGDDEYVERLRIVEEELIDDYARGAMTARERELFKKHFLSTPKRMNKLAAAQAMVEFATATAAVRREETRDKDLRRRVMFFPRWRIAIYAALVLGAGLGVWRLSSGRSDVEQAMTAMNQAYREQRTLKSRITRLDYAPFVETRGEEQGQVDLTARDRAERFLLDATAEGPNSAAHHALGRLYLARKKFDQAIAEFEKAQKIDPDNPGLHSDLGAALFEQGNLGAPPGAAGGDPRLFNRSLEHLNRALELDGSTLEAIFNRALLRQSAGLLAPAKEDWESYLKKDATSQWAEEARNNLRLIEKQNGKVLQRENDLFLDFQQAYRAGDDRAALRVFSRGHLRDGNHIAGKLIDEFLDLTQRGERKEAQDRLKALAFAGEAAMRNFGERYFADIARFYRTAPDAHAPRLTRARELMKSAYQSYAQTHNNQAIESYLEARHLFDSSGNLGEALLAEFWAGFCRLGHADAQGSLLTFNRVAAVSEVRGYKWLEALALIGATNSQIRLMEYSQAIRSGGRAYRLSQQIADDNGMLRCLSILANTYRRLGKFHDSWQAAQQGINLASGINADPSQVVGFYAACAWDSDSLGLYSAALDYARECVRLGEAMNSPPLIMSRYLALLGLVQMKLKNYDEAIANIERGFEIGQRQPDEQSAQENTAYALTHLGRAYRLSGALTKSLAALEQALEFGRRKNYTWMVHQATKERLLVLIAQGETDAARKELQRLLSLYEQQRARIMEENDRNSFFDQEQGVYDVAIDFACSQLNDPAQALGYSEMSRARSLLDVVARKEQAGANADETGLRHSAATRPINPDEIRARMSDQAQILQYAALEDKLVILSISKQRIEWKSVPVSSNQLTQLAVNCLAQLSRPPRSKHSGPPPGVSELYEILIEPVASLLGRNKSLWIIPDKILHFLPFGALFSAASNKHLIEEFAVGYAPSASLFVIATEAARQKSGSVREHLLSVGNPGFDPKQYPKFADLPSAAREATEITQYYDSHALLVGSLAKKAAVLREMKRADVVHLALHHAPDERFPSFSKLLLASETENAGHGTEESGALTAREIYQLNLSRARLVVLSACQTRAEQCFGGEGAIGISRPFEAAGIPLVVTSLWDVDSPSTAELMTGFHRLRKSRALSTTEALREAQLEMLRGDSALYKHPYYWAAFVVAGGQAGF
jgi:CHAT domain-containing protein